MPRISAGIVLYRVWRGTLQVLLVHPGGPLWQRRDEGAWTIPKGEVAAGEDDLAAAIREVAEETGLTLAGPFVPLGEVRQKGGKIVRAWACAGDCDPAALRSNTFTLQWPPRSGQFRRFPEVDRAEFFDLPQARRKINPAQALLLSALERAVAGRADPP